MENNIVNWITGKADLNLVSLQELKDIVQQYPYFTLAQLLLTVKMKRDNDPEYPLQLQKTALNFQNPQWLHFQLESLDIAICQQDQTESYSIPFETAETPIIKEQIDANENLSNNNGVATPIKEHKFSDHVSEIENNPETILESLTDIRAIEEKNILPETSTSNKSVLEEDSTPKNIPNEQATIDLSESDTQELFVEKVLLDPIIEPHELPIENNPATEYSAEVKPNTEIKQEQKIPIEQPNQRLEEGLATTSNIDLDSAASSEEDMPLLSSLPGKEDISAEKDEFIEKEDETPSRLSSMLEAQAAAFKSIDTKKQELAYENPTLLHTKDYFASIGVTTDNTLNTDFGQKVKRFSDWLKQMKSIGISNIGEQKDPVDNNIILQKADESNKSSAVLTETMVDILLQQGKKPEAIEILEKLSLLKPEKSSYFASLINNLKN